MDFRLELTRLKPVSVKIAGCCCCALLWTQLGFAAVPKHKKPVQPPTPPPEQQAPVIPQPPPTPEQMPAVPPQVSMSNGMLSITAENSTLGDILTAVRKQTGAALEVPPTVAGERVAAKLGPDNPRNVLQDLLQGSKFDYIIIGSEQDPNAVQRIIMTPRTTGGPTPPMPMAANQTPYQPPPEPPEDNYQPPPDVSNDSAADEEPQQHEPASPEQQPPAPNTAQPNANQQPKTPEQLLRELQQLQQQQQQNVQRNPQPE